MRPDDRQLQQQVLAAIATECGAESAHIGVTVRRGVTTLSGHVAKCRDRLAAEYAARDVAGVRAIAQQINVRPCDVSKTADDEIADRAVSILEWDLPLPANSVRVTVEHGIVELSGRVRSAHQRRTAERDVRKLHGVRDVVNRLRLDAVPTATTQTDIINMAIYAVGDGTVVIEGRVRSSQERDDAEGALWSAPGITRVDNRLVVDP